MTNRSGWGAEPFPEVYHVAETIAQVLRQEARQVNDELFSIETKLRAVRLASTPDQKTFALRALSRIVTIRLAALASTTSLITKTGAPTI